MIPLIGPGLHARFQALRPDLEQAGVEPLNIAQVFVPVGPYRGAVPGLPRVLFVGQCTRGYGEADIADFDAAWKRGEEIVQSDFFPSGRTAFWRFARGVMRGVASRLERDAADDDTRLAASVGWSNLAKVGDVKGNATSSAIGVQADLCVSALHAEVECMRPDAVVVATGKYAKAEIFDRFFGAEGWTPAPYKECGVYLKRDAALSVPIIAWTAHPRRLSYQGAAVFAAAMGEVTAALSTRTPAR